MDKVPAEQMNIQTFKPPGPVANALLRSEMPVRFIMGPYGSGKTNLLIFDALTFAARMPLCVDGVRRFKGLVIRDEYAQLWDTTIETWHSWFPETVGKWQGSRGRKAVHELRFDQPDGTILEVRMEFLAIGDKKIESVLRGTEFNWAMMNEADLLSGDILTHLISRAEQRRYPPVRLLPDSAFRINEDGEREATFPVSVVGDLNPPDDDCWVYHLFEEEKPYGHEMFKQPSGRGPHGENRLAISRSRYVEIAKLNAHKPWFVKRMVDGEYGYSRDGMPVYGDEYVDDVHYANEKLEPLPALGLRISFDQGVVGPAMLIMQYTYDGQLRVLDELVPGWMGPTAFGQRCKTLLEQDYKGCEIIAATADPAGWQGSDKSQREDADLAWSEIISEQLASVAPPLMPAPTNELHPRIDTIKQLLLLRITANKPGLILSSKCPMLRKGFLSKYRYIVDAKTGRKTSDPKPDKKNGFSNPHDALQYGALEIFGLAGVIIGEPGKPGRIKLGGDDDLPPGSAQSMTDFDVFET